MDIILLIKNNDFEKIIKIIDSNTNIDYDIRDDSMIYFVQYVVNLNQYEILKKIINKNIRLDLVDSDKRTILYNPIKYKYDKVFNLLIDTSVIGESIINMRDSVGLTSLHYAVLFNNTYAFKKLLEMGADPFILDNNNNNVFEFCIINNNNDMLVLLLDTIDYNIINNNKTLLQFAINSPLLHIVSKILLKKNINNRDDEGMTILHLSIIHDNYDLYVKLLENNIDINIQDNYGNTCLHYCFIENRSKYIKKLLDRSDLEYNLININGSIPLHIQLTSTNMDYEEMILNSNLNIQDNSGKTCLLLLYSKKLCEKYKDILVNKELNFFINKDIIDNNIADSMIDILANSYYNQIQKNKKKLTLDWEKNCNNKDCINMIKKVIIKEKRTLPRINNLLILDNSIFVDTCYYTGMSIDILAGLLLLNKDFKDLELGIILDYPLTINLELDAYYKKIGIEYKLDFSNIEITWAYQQIFYPSYFDNEIKKKMKTMKYIVIPIGIICNISHANILFWDLTKNTIERFEPHGATNPVGFNYNSTLLDKILYDKFKSFDTNITYLAPNKFLPAIGFQVLENLEYNKRIGDPNGFCGIWCVWWIYQRMLNINNNLNASDIILQIRYDSKSFKNIIRNFSHKVTSIRDIYLKEHNLDINDIINNNYDDNILKDIEKKVISDLD
jgi:ankyrin repeat protein